MRQLSLIVLVSLLLCGTSTAEAEKRVLPGHAEAVQVMLPKGKVTILYVEAAEGMMVYVESGGVTVKSRKLFIGDGQYAVRYEARVDGFFLPEGKKNVAGVELKPGGKLKFAKENRQAWAEKPGEVYVLVPEITLEGIE
jgi:hypothetical protein